MNLIVGLGNPGKKYEKTRHNVGFRIVQNLLNLNHTPGDAKLDKKFDSIYFKVSLDDEKTLLVMPQTYMNESGKAISQWINFYKIDPDDVLIVHDEIDLPLEEIRVSSGGSAGHKGIDSILKTIGGAISRLRIGIENRKEYRVPPTDDYVLQNFTAQEEQTFKEKIIPEALEIIKKWLKSHRSALDPTSKRKP